MIKSFRHKAIEGLFKLGSKAGIQPSHAKRLRLQRGKLDTSNQPKIWICPDGSFMRWRVT